MLQNGLDITDKTYRVSISRYRQIIFFFGGVTLVIGMQWLFGVFALFAEPRAILKEEFLGAFVLFPPLFIYAMWFSFGHEELVFKERSLLLVKSNRLFKIRREFKIDDIQAIETIEKRFSSDNWIDANRQRIRETQRAFPFWVKMGRLELVLRNGKRKTFFNGLLDEEVEKIKDEISREIEKRVVLIRVGK